MVQTTGNAQLGGVQPGFDNRSYHSPGLKSAPDASGAIHAAMNARNNIQYMFQSVRKNLALQSFLFGIFSVDHLLSAFVDMRTILKPRIMQRYDSERGWALGNLSGEG